MALTHPFAPIIDQNSKILILGSFPSIKSFENSFYYSHPKNQFWRLLARVLNENEPKSVEEKVAFLQRHHIALWDMVKSCKRENSLDTSLKNIQVNDIAALLKEYPNIKAVFFTGRKAESLYKKYFSNLPYPFFYLPSPSPAMQKMSFEEKLQKWSILTKFLR